MQKELLSAYMDGEIVNPELTNELCESPSLQQSWVNFHMVRTVMRNETHVFLGADFTAKMADLIENEEKHSSDIQVSQPSVREVEKLSFVQKLRAVFAPVVQVAIAAGVCLVAVLGVQSFKTQNDVNNAPEIPVLQTLPFNNSVQEVSYNAPVRDVATAEQIEQKNRRIGVMLQNYELQRRMHTDTLSFANGAK